jgi:heme-degrading monooxygenase HmoA
MFALLTTAKLKADTQNDAIRIFDAKVVSAAKMQKGFRAIYLLTDSKTGKTVSISIWESRDDAINCERSGYYKAQLDEFQGFCTAPLAPEVYEVSVHG